MPNRANRRKPLQEKYQIAEESERSTEKHLPMLSLPLAETAQPLEPDVTAPVLPKDQPAKRVYSTWVRAIWHWVGGRWQWGSLFAGACTMIKLGEYGVGWFLLALAAFAASSKISHWNGAEHLAKTKRIRTFGYVLVGVSMVFLTVVTVSVKDAAPWSHLAVTSHKIALRAVLVIASDTRDTSGGLWLLREDYIVPINAAVLIQISNVTDAPVSIQKFTLSMKRDATGDWVVLPVIRAIGRLYCCVPDTSKLDRVHEIQLDNGGLIRVLQNGLASRTQIATWMLFQFPPGFIPGGAGTAMFKLWDETGKEYMAEGQLAQINISAPETTYGGVESQSKPRNKPKELTPDVHEEMERLTMKTIASPVTDLRWVPIGHVDIE